MMVGVDWMMVGDGLDDGGGRIGGWWGMDWMMVWSGLDDHGGWIG